MSVEELLEFIRTRLRDPRQIIFYVWLVWALWSFVRNRILRRTPEDEEQAEPPEPVAAPPPPRRVPPPPAPVPARPPTPAEAARAGERPISRDARVFTREKRDDTPWARALERAHALRQRVAADRTLRRLEPIVVDDVIDPLQSALQQASRALPEAAVHARGARAMLTLGVLERVVRERAQDGDRARLTAVDAITDACHAPLRSYAQAEDLELRGVHPVAIRAPLPQAASTSDWTDQLLLVPVPPGLGTQLNDYTAVLHELGRRWYAALPELATDLRAELGVGERMRLLEAQSSYDAASIQACFGPWLPALFADTALTLRLGSGYVTGLRKSVARDAQVTHGQAEGSYLSGRPPALLRLRAATRALTALGRHDEAEHHDKAFAAEHQGLERSYLPLADSRVLVIDSSHWLAFTDALSQVLLHTPQAALGGVALRDVPGLSQSLEEQREQRTLAQSVAGKRLPSRLDAAQLLCGALLAWDSGLDPELALAQFHQALAPRAARDSQAERGASAAREPRSLHAAFRDPRTLRSAIVLGAAFERPRSQR